MPAVPSSSPPVVIYTDGACSGNPGPGGWAWAIPGGAFASGAAAHTTNQRMEIQAALEALQANGSLEEPVEIVSDSTYVVHCFRDRWWEGWLRKGWVNSQRKPVANRDLWEPLVALVQERGNVTFRWVKGHSGDPMNDLVDRLAVEAGIAQKGRQGIGSVGRGADRAAAASRAAVAPGDPHHELVVVGHADRDVSAAQAALAIAVADRAAQIPELRVVTGLRRGAELLAATVAEGEGVPVLAVLPFPEPDRDWPDDDRESFRAALDEAERFVVLADERPATAQGATAALRRRDAWLADHADEALVVWDGVEDRVGRLHRTLVERLGAAKVTVIPLDPLDPRSGA